MLLKQATLAGIANGTVTLVFRRWSRAPVRPGSTFRSPVGVISVIDVEPIRSKAITEQAAGSAGYPSRSALLEDLARYPAGKLYRIGVVLAGTDPRIELRSRADLGRAERQQLQEKVTKLGARSADGPWGLRVLRLIAESPSVRAPDLAREVGMETSRFKARVRQLKELGLTESLEVGYRLSPRGRAFLRLPRPRRA